MSHNLLDHTSVLKLLGEKFNNGSYSPLVDSRPIGSISHVLDFSSPLVKPPGPPALDDYLNKRPPPPPGVTVPPGNTVLQQGFRDAVESMKQHGLIERNELGSSFPNLRAVSLFGVFMDPGLPSLFWDSRH